MVAPASLREGQGQDTGGLGAVSPRPGDKDFRSEPVLLPRSKRATQHQTMTQTEEGWPGLSALSISMTGAVLGSWLVVPLSWPGRPCTQRNK